MHAHQLLVRSRLRAPLAPLPSQAGATHRGVSAARGEERRHGAAGAAAARSRARCRPGVGFRAAIGFFWAVQR